MKIIIKMVSVLAVIVGLLSVLAGAMVLLGLFNPGYPYFAILIAYNIAMGLFSIYTGFYIWQMKHKALLFCYMITIAHILVYLSLISIFSEIISPQSIAAMAFRSLLWVIFTGLILYNRSGIKKDEAKSD